MEIEIKEGDLVEIETDNGQFYRGTVVEMIATIIKIEDCECNVHLIVSGSIKHFEIIEAADDDDEPETLPGDPEAVIIFSDALWLLVDSPRFLEYTDQEKRRIADLCKLLADCKKE